MRRHCGAWGLDVLCLTIDYFTCLSAWQSSRTSCNTIWCFTSRSKKAVFHHHFPSSFYFPIFAVVLSADLVAGPIIYVPHVTFMELMRLLFPECMCRAVLEKEVPNCNACCWEEAGITIADVTWLPCKWVKCSIPHQRKGICWELSSSMCDPVADLLWVITMRRFYYLVLNSQEDWSVLPSFFIYSVVPCTVCNNSKSVLWFFFLLCMSRAEI